MKTRLVLLAVSFVSLIILSPILLADEQPVVISVKRMSMDMALAAGKAAIDACRKEGVQIGVTIIDRGGHPQVVLRDVLAVDITLEVSRLKAYTAMSFNTPTSDLGERLSAVNFNFDGTLANAGGLPINVGGTLFGGIGVSGSPSGLTDEKCAQAGLDAIFDDLAMAD
jgi:uncharacterized protein GlcG (DUF336 family)